MSGTMSVSFINFIADEYINRRFFVFFDIYVPSTDGIFKAGVLSNIKKNEKYM